MHKRRLNQLKLHLTIRPAGPILIKSGDDGGLDPTLPAMNFVRTRHPRQGQPTIYLPGSSLKGVIRSHSERILHTVFPDDKSACCDPLDHDNNCAAALREEADTAVQYRQSCLACRLFGNTTHAAHFLSADAYPPRPINTLPTRQNVAIDRLSGGALHPFDMEVALEGDFRAALTLVNFELWQIGLLALTLRDLDEGRVRLGFAKSRGLGAVTVHFRALQVSYPGQFGAPAFDFAAQLVGAGALAPDLTADYDLTGDDRLPYPDAATGEMDDLDATWGRPSIRFTEEAAIIAVLGAATRRWADFVARRKEQA